MNDRFTKGSRVVSVRIPDQTETVPAADPTEVIPQEPELDETRDTSLTSTGRIVKWWRGRDDPLYELVVHDAATGELLHHDVSADPEDALLDAAESLVPPDPADLT